MLKLSVTPVTIVTVFGDMGFLYIPTAIASVTQRWEQVVTSVTNMALSVTHKILVICRFSYFVTSVTNVTSKKVKFLHFLLFASYMTACVLKCTAFVRERLCFVRLGTKFASETTDFASYKTIFASCATFDNKPTICHNVNVGIHKQFNSPKGGNKYEKN